MIELAKYTSKNKQYKNFNVWYEEVPNGIIAMIDPTYQQFVAWFKNFEEMDSYFTFIDKKLKQ